MCVCVCVCVRVRVRVRACVWVCATVCLLVHTHINMYAVLDAGSDPFRKIPIPLGDQYFTELNGTKNRTKYQVD